MKLEFYDCVYYDVDVCKIFSRVSFLIFTGEEMKLLRQWTHISLSELKGLQNRFRYSELFRQFTNSRMQASLSYFIINCGARKYSQQRNVKLLRKKYLYRVLCKRRMEFWERYSCNRQHLVNYFTRGMYFLNNFFSLDRIPG